MGIFICCASQSPSYTARNLVNAQLIFGEQWMICIFSCIKPNIFIVCYVPLRLLKDELLFYVHSCIRGLQEHPQVEWSTGKTHRTQHIVILMSKIYYSERTQSRIRKGKKVHGPKFLGNQGQVSGVTQNTVTPESNCGNTSVYQGSSFRDWSYRHPSPGTDQNSRLLESIQHKSHCL